MNEDNKISDQVIITFINGLKDIAVLLINRIFDERSKNPPS